MKYRNDKIWSTRMSVTTETTGDSEFTQVSKSVRSKNQVQGMFICRSTICCSELLKLIRFLDFILKRMWELGIKGENFGIV
jgi:hypothetical protein